MSCSKKIKVWLPHETLEFSFRKENIFFRSMRTTVCAPVTSSMAFEFWIRKPNIGVVYGDAEYIGMRTGRWHVGSFERDRLLRWNYIDACAVYRRSIWEQNRGYDGTMPVQGLEDWDFWLSTLAHGWKFAYVPEVLFEYRVAKTR